MARPKRPGEPNAGPNSTPFSSGMVKLSEGSEGLTSATWTVRAIPSLTGSGKRLHIAGEARPGIGAGLMRHRFTDSLKGWHVGARLGLRW